MGGERHEDVELFTPHYRGAHALQPRQDRLPDLRRRIPPGRRSFCAASARRGGIPVTHEYPHNPMLDSVTISRVTGFADFGFTRRQREFLATGWSTPGASWNGGPARSPRRNAIP